jgi:hypothetical protein
VPKNKSDRRSDPHATGMAGEYFVTEQLFRLGHTPALTLGNAKKIDIIVRTKSGKHFDVSVKAIRGGGKWGVGNVDYSGDKKLFFVFLHYKKFEDPTDRPEAFIVPAVFVERNKRRWFKQFGIYYSHHKLKANLTSYKEAWKCFN